MKATSDEPTELWRKQAVCLCAQAARANDLSQAGRRRHTRSGRGRARDPRNSERPPPVVMFLL